MYRTVRHNPISFFQVLIAHCDLYRRLSDPISLQGSDHVELKHRKINSGPITPILPTHVEVVIHRTYEKEQTLNRSRYDSLMSVEGQSCETSARQPDENTISIDVGSYDKI
jgi:hypothetical protein